MIRAQRRPAGLTAVRIRKHATSLLIVGSLLALAGCSDDESGSSNSAPSETSSTRQSVSPSSTEGAEQAAVLAVYARSWQAQADAYAKASSTGTDLRKTTTLRALGSIEQDLKAMRKAGQVTTGRPVIHPGIPKVIPGDIPKATLTDCVDTTNWTLINQATKKKVPLPSSRLVKYVSTATLEKWGTKWMVTELTAQDQSC